MISINNNLGDLEDTTLSNSTKINNIKNSKYLKNIYNILLYDLKTQIDFRGMFFDEIFEVNAKQNDFIELNLKYLLEYEDMSEPNFVNTYYEIFDENNNSLYISTINNNDYQYFSNKVFVDENIFIISQKMLKI